MSIWTPASASESIARTVETSLRAARAARTAVRVAGREVDGIDLIELGPGQQVIPMWPEALAHDRDRALGIGVHVDERSPLRLRSPRRLDAYAQRFQLPLRPVPEVVIAERGEKEALARQACKLHGGDRSAPSRFLPVLERVNDLAGFRHTLHPCEFDPLNVPDDSDPHRAG